MNTATIRWRLFALVVGIGIGVLIVIGILHHGLQISLLNN
jgi:hypothetical protein